MVKQVIPESCAKTGFVYLKLQWTMTDSDMMMGDFGAQWFEVQFQTGKTGKEIQEPPVSWRMLRQKRKTWHRKPATHQQIHSITLLRCGLNVCGFLFLWRERAEKREQTWRQAWNERINPFLNFWAHMGGWGWSGTVFANHIHSGHPST